MSAYEVQAGDHFWLTLKPLKAKYTRQQLVEIISIVKEAMAELSQKGYVDEAGWNDHLLVRRPFADGNHFEFHIYDDALVVYFKRERRRIIRMVGIYDHATIP